jgi:metal-dependent amidase/aminoacylase/carboxypeptidase family protein
MAFAEISEENIKDLLSTKDSKETIRAVKRCIFRFPEQEKLEKNTTSTFTNEIAELSKKFA